MKKRNQTDYYKSLPKKRMSSGVIIRNSAGEILVLKTTYKDHWEIPGGVVEKSESPKETAKREILEEIDLEISVTSCLVIHYRRSLTGKDENITFVFDGGVLNSDKKMNLNHQEILEARFVSFEEASALVGKKIASRLPFCQQALKEQRTIYLESISETDPAHTT
jgi:8-oxo-dGTP diphosphatase